MSGSEPQRRQVPPDPRSDRIDPVTVRIGGVRWTVRSAEVAPFLAEVLRAPDAHLERGELLIRNTPLVTMSRIPNAASPPAQWMLRRTNYGRPIARFRDFFRPAGPMRAFWNALAFEQAGIPTPRVFAAGIERRLHKPVVGYLLVECIHPASTLIEYWAENGRVPVRIIHRVAEVIANMHERGFIHGDLTINNILLDEHREPRLIDLERVRSRDRPIKQREAVNDFFRLARHLNELDRATQLSSLRLLKRYCEVRQWQGRERALTLAILNRVQPKRNAVRWDHNSKCSFPAAES